MQPPTCLSSAVAHTAVWRGAVLVERDGDEELLPVIAPVRKTSPRMALPHFDFANGDSGVIGSRIKGA